jgi:uncharacterized protein (TIGR00251 family)
MRPKGYLKANATGCTITIYASPGASKTEVAGYNEWRKALHIRIAAEPRDGAANEELIRFMAGKLSLPTSSVRLVRGEKSGLKTISVPIPADRVEELLGDV